MKAYFNKEAVYKETPGMMDCLSLANQSEVWAHGLLESLEKLQSSGEDRDTIGEAGQGSEGRLERKRLRI